MAAYKTYADRIAKYRCPGGALVNMTDSQKRALHRMKNEWAASLNELYKTLEAEKADAFIKPLLKRLTK
jgi:hypothetical protein